jgi:hypothetical protein
MYRSEETAEPIVDLLNGGVSVAGIAAREADGKMESPGMAPQRLEKIESAPGNGMGSEASDPQHLVRGRAADRARLPTSRKNHEVAEKGAQRSEIARCKTEIGACVSLEGRRE